MLSFECNDVDVLDSFAPRSTSPTVHLHQHLSTDGACVMVENAVSQWCMDSNNGAISQVTPNSEVAVHHVRYRKILYGELKLPASLAPTFSFGKVSLKVSSDAVRSHR
jgi:hypothetical protein